MSPRFLKTFVVAILTILFFAALVMVSVVSAGRLPARFAPFALDNLPSPLTITGSPLQVTVGADSSIQVYYNGQGQVYGFQDSSADSGIWLRVGSDIYGPDSCFSGRSTTNMYTVRPWTTVSHSGPTGSGTAGDPWVITTVLDAGATGVRVTQRASYVNGQAYFRLEWAVTNASGSSQTVNLFHAVDSYFANDDYGRGYYDAASGAVGGYIPSGPWYMLFVPTSPATAHKEGWFFDIWAASGIAATISHVRCRGRATPGRGSTTPSTPARMAWTTASGCNGSGRSGRAPARRSGIGGRSAASPLCPARRRRRPHRPKRVRRRPRRRRRQHLRRHPRQRVTPGGCGGPTEAGTVVRTLAYHQLTSFTSRPGVHTRGDSPSILSADGSRAAFLVGGEPSHVYVINADGTGLREVDTHPAGDWTNVDISADGSVVLSSYGGSGTGGGVARIVNADGSNAHTVFAAGNGKYFRLSADGTKVYFASGGSFDWGGQSHTAGLYVINADGTGLRQILDRARVHALFGKPIPELEFYWHGPPFDVSDDGSHLVLQVLVPDIGWPIMRVNGDGSDLQAYALFPNNEHPDVGNLGISGDGRVAFYEVTSNWELGVFNWDGSGKRVLATGVGGANSSGEVVQLTYDGSKLHYGSLNRLYNTDGSGVLQPVAGGPTLGGDPPLMTSQWYRSSMNRDATRFLFTFDYNTYVNGALVPEQLGLMELNPGSLGPAPGLTEPRIAPPYLVIGDGSTTAFSVRMSTTNTHLRTNSVVFRNGLEVNSNIVNDGVLYDDGSNGDITAGDGRFTYGFIRANTGATVGPHTARMKTEVRAADGRRHATALDVAQLDVVTAVPPGMGTCTPTPTPTPTRTPGGCGGPTEAGTVVRTLAYHQLTSFTSFPANTRWQTGLHPLGRREPRRLCNDRALLLTSMSSMRMARGCARWTRFPATGRRQWTSAPTDRRCCRATAPRCASPMRTARVRTRSWI